MDFAYLIELELESTNICSSGRTILCMSSKNIWELF